MIPVVDTNLQFASGDDTGPEHALQRYLSGMDGCHVLRAVMVTTAASHAGTVDQLNRATRSATTPGLGGMPQGMVAGCDLSSSGFVEELTTLCGFSHLKGIQHRVMNPARGIDADCAIDFEAAHENVECVARAGLVLELKASPGIGERLQRVARLWPLLRFVLDVSAPADTDCVEGLTACDNVSIKVTGCAPGLLSHVNRVGAERVLLGSASEAIDHQRGEVWSHYAVTARQLAASERDRIFRTNATVLYQLA